MMQSGTSLNTGGNRSPPQPYHPHHHHLGQHSGSTTQHKISAQWTKQFQQQSVATDHARMEHQGLSRSPSSNLINGNASKATAPTRCDLPTAVHIAQISSSDEDYLDFEEADEFQMEDELNMQNRNVMRQNQQKSFIDKKNTSSSQQQQQSMEQANTAPPQLHKQQQKPQFAKPRKQIEKVQLKSNISPTRGEPLHQWDKRSPTRGGAGAAQQQQQLQSHNINNAMQGLGPSNANASPKYGERAKKISFQEGLSLQNKTKKLAKKSPPQSPSGSSSRVTKTKMTKQQLQQLRDQQQQAAQASGSAQAKSTFSLRNIVPAQTSASGTNPKHSQSVQEAPPQQKSKQSSNGAAAAGAAAHNRTVFKKEMVAKKGPDSKQRRKVVKVLNIGEAINKKDLIRIRSGSPGLRAGQQKDQLANGTTFQGEMTHHGMASDLQEIQRFNFVLMSRSIDVHEDHHQNGAAQQLSQQVPPQQLMSIQHPPQTLKEQAKQENQVGTGKYFSLPYQRRLRSASPPALQICTENYIVYS